MAPHPLSYQELPYDPEYAVYNRRLTPERLNHLTDNEQYWAVRAGVVLRHTGELPIEVSGLDAIALLDRVFPRDVSTLKSNRYSYQLACFHEGGIITDGILVRLDHDRFWMVQADGTCTSGSKRTPTDSTSKSTTHSHGPGTPVQVLDETGQTRSGKLCTMPFYDDERLIPRGKIIDIPTKT